MHPRFFYSHGFHSRPSRLVWFLIGGLSASWWIHRKQSHYPSLEQHFGRCIRQPVPPLPQNQTQNQDDHRLRDPRPPALPWGYPEAHRERQFDEEKAKLQAIGRQAEDFMTKLSEDALDSAMTTMQALQRKLAEHRQERERAQRELERQFEEQKQNPHRFV
ncbi:hypothetical protein C8F01DRAFT_1124391 [Mycena amicta]|nr:hypothetical protein C8F01DRAFT_1124391 [Mycena amicta]